MKILFLTFAIAIFAVSAGGAGAGNFWASCNYATAQANQSLTRDGAQTYSYTAAYEGYQWGGGCWNNNDVDEGWGDPPQDVNTHGEGADCSGLVFKTWKESENTSNGGLYYWNPIRNVHGPYTAASFRDGVGAPNGLISKAVAGVMDGFASGTHVGLIFFRGSGGWDQIIEAKCESCGTNIMSETYRSQSAYGGIRRIGWTG